MSTSPLRLPFDASQGDGMWAEPWFPCRQSRTLTSAAESFYAHAIALLRALLALAASDESQAASRLRPRSGRVVRVPAGGAVNIKVREPNPKKCLSISSPCSLSRFVLSSSRYISMPQTEIGFFDFELHIRATSHRPSFGIKQFVQFYVVRL